MYFASHGKLILALETAHFVVCKDRHKNTQAYRAPDKAKRHETHNGVQSTSMMITNGSVTNIDSVEALKSALSRI